MILVYSAELSPRILYITKFLFSDVLHVPCQVTMNFEEFADYQGPKINYSGKKNEDISILPHSLLFEKGIRQLVPEVNWIGEMPVLFPVKEDAFLPFDLFAAAFYMITRYEEYLPQQKDEHGRVLAEESLGCKNGFLDKPVVDHWAIWLKEVIKKKYPSYPFPERSYRFIPTIDVDIAFAYRHRTVFRTLGAAAKAVLKGEVNDTIRRFQTLVLKKNDPYDSFDLLTVWFTKFNLQPKFFFLSGKYGRFDKNISPTHPAMKELVAKVHRNYAVGIHPSYGSEGNGNVLQFEISTLKKLVNDNVTISRQHFLKLRFPETYRALIENGIEEDYTMGYASLPGFRAGTCTPFLFFDLLAESETSLRITPFQVMDGTLNQYMNMSTIEAFEVCKNLIQEVKHVNGTFVSLWHNESLSEMREWKGWSKVFYKLLEEAL
jgi:hypothetical protein